jgi:uncharacterized protein (TIGR02217 family)
MSFLETPRFPDYLAFGLVVGPVDSRTTIRTDGGQVFTNLNWSHYLTRFDGTTTARTQAQRDEIDNFFRAVRADGFRIRDYSDYQAGAFGVLTAITSTTFQLGKMYSKGSATYTRKITKPVSTIALSGGGTYTVDYTTGIVTKVSGANPTAWTGEFDIPVRFEANELTWQVVGRAAGGLMYVADQLKMMEIVL